MGAFVAYGVEAGLALLCFYLLYRCLLSNQNQPVFNRIVLLSGYVGAFLLPCCISLYGAMWPLNPMRRAGIVDFEGGEAFIAQASRASWADYIVMIYFVGAVGTLLLSIVGVCRLILVLRRADRRKYKGYVLAVLSDNRHAPFSWLRYIAMSADDLRSFGPVVMLHEEAHIKACHWLDLLLAQAVCVVLWYNPASWLMRDELRAVHEYYADRAVLLAGTDARNYQLMLIKKAVGHRFPSVANSLNHSKLKKRITMMCNLKSGKGSRIRALAVVPAFALALAVVNIPVVASALSSVASASVENLGKGSGKISMQQGETIALVAAESGSSIAVISANSAQESAEAVEKPEVMPKYPGGELKMFEFLMKNLKYPSEAEEQQVEGKVLVRFIVEANGQITNIEVLKPVHPLLDAEAVRVVSQFPAWTPGTVDGKPVRCTFALPINFKLTPKDKTASKPVVFIDGVRADNTQMNDVPGSDIKSITIIKDNPAYPDGAIYVTMK